MSDVLPPGSERASRHLALIVSNEGYHRYTRLAIVCPISEMRDDYPMHVPLDGRTITVGSVECEHVRTVDIRAHLAEILEQLPADLLEAVMDRLILSLE